MVTNNALNKYFLLFAFWDMEDYLIIQQISFNLFPNSTGKNILTFWVRLTWVQANAFVGRSEKGLQDQESIQRTKTRALGSLDIGLYNLAPLRSGPAM